jgi:hypothetical protein
MCAARETAPFSAAATKYWICRNENAIAAETINAVVGCRFSAERGKYPANLALPHERPATELLFASSGGALD